MPGYGDRLHRRRQAEVDRPKVRCLGQRLLAHGAHGGLRHTPAGGQVRHREEASVLVELILVPLRARARISARSGTSRCPLDRGDRDALATTHLDVVAEPTSGRDTLVSRLRDELSLARRTTPRFSGRALGLYEPLTGCRRFRSRHRCGSSNEYRQWRRRISACHSGSGLGSSWV